MIKKKKEGPIAHQPVIDYSATTSSCLGDDTSDDDYIVFEDDTSTTISDPFWSDIDSSTEDSDDDTDSCGSHSEDLVITGLLGGGQVQIPTAMHVHQGRHIVHL